MKVAIHHRPGSFSDRWIEYCEAIGIPFKIVNVFDNDIIGQLDGCIGLMWHPHHALYEDVIAAKKILYALEHAGIKVFPDFRTAWHFDDKVAQKYLLEAIGAPLVRSYVFYNRAKALVWAESAQYPVVFKLKGGAASSNVRLIKTRNEALRAINKAFGRGFSQFDRRSFFVDTLKAYRQGRVSFLSVVKGIARFFYPPRFARLHPREKGYIYFQDFMPGNDHDLRVVVIGPRAFAIKRGVRSGDFRASGSGFLCYARSEIDDRCVKIAFSVNEKLGAQSVAYDFVYDSNGNPQIVEISYGFSVEPYDSCPGYWDANMEWHDRSVRPQHWMIDEFIKENV